MPRMSTNTGRNCVEPKAVSQLLAPSWLSFDMPMK